MKSKFDFFEIVTLQTDNPKYRHLNGSRGAILGMSPEKNDVPVQNYGVYFYRLEEVYSFDESELVATGEFDKRENFYSGDSVHVTVDPETGEGNIEP